MYRARDARLNRDVALKVLPPELVADADGKRRFIREAQAAAALSHPNIATVYEVGESDGISFIAMELIDGRRLSEVLEGRPLLLRRALELTSEIAEGLARAHEKSVVHRDIKPANIMVTKEGHAKIIDFGLAKLVERVSYDSLGVTVADNTAPGVVLGTTAYMSPEQGPGMSSIIRTDIFSLGVVFFEMVDAPPVPCADGHRDAQRDPHGARATTDRWERLPFFGGTASFIVVSKRIPTTGTRRRATSVRSSVD